MIKSLMQMAVKVASDAVDTARRARASPFDLGGRVPPPRAASLLAGRLAEAYPQLSSAPPAVCAAVRTMTTMLDASSVCIEETHRTTVDALAAKALPATADSPQRLPGLVKSCDQSAGMERLSSARKPPHELSSTLLVWPLQVAT